MHINNNLACFNLLPIYTFSNIIHIKSFYLKYKIYGTLDSFGCLHEWFYMSKENVLTFQQDELYLRFAFDVFNIEIWGLNKD